MIRVTPTRRGKLAIRPMFEGAAEGMHFGPADGPERSADYRVSLPIARRGEPDTEEFSLRITTPEALLAQAKEHAGTLAEGATMIVSHADGDALFQEVTALLDRCDAGSLNASVEPLQQFFKWGWADRVQATRLALGPRPLELHGVTLPDGDSFRSLYPWDNEEVDYSVCLEVRGNDEESAVFGVRIVTPEALLRQSADTFRILAHDGVLVVSQFEWRETLKDLERLVGTCRAADFQQSTWLLRRYFTPLPGRPISRPTTMTSRSYRPEATE